jgi:hypothetical protein
VKRFKLKQNQCGQSMTEFLICASFALVPLFLGISLLGKYIDIKQTSIQAARYEAWEYTVWYADNNEPMTGFNAVPQPIKSTTQTQKEMKQRFFSGSGTADTTSQITATDKTTGWSVGTANPLWVDHTGTRLYKGTNGTADTLGSSQATPTLPVVGTVMNTLFDVIDWAFSALGSLMSFVGSSVGFTAINTDGYANSTVSMQIEVNPKFRNLDDEDNRIIDAGSNTLDFASTASVLSDAWNAGGVEHTYNQAGGAVPTTLLNELYNSLPQFVRDALTVVTLLAPEMRLCHPGGIWGANDKGSLWLGHIDIDAVHPDRLEDGGTHVCDDAGICTFVPTTPRLESSRDCVH